MKEIVYSAMYRRKNVDFITFQQYHGNDTSFITHIDYLGFEYGRDAQVLQLDMVYRLPKNRNIALQLFYMRHGEVDFLTSHADANSHTGATPSGDIVAETYKVSISGEYSIDNGISFVDIRIWANQNLIGMRDYTKSTRRYNDLRSDTQHTLRFSLII